MVQANKAATRVELGETVTALCGRYDALLGETAPALSERAEAELRGLAHVFDLEGADENAPAEVWRALRPVLIGQDHSDGGITPPLTVLVVEDDPDAAAALVDCLTDAGHRVVGPLHDAASARTHAGLHAFDVALLDINLSGEDTGVDLARSLKASWGVPVMFLSGDVTTAARNADMAEAMLIKPYKGRDVIEALGVAWRRGAIAA